MLVRRSMSRTGATHRRSFAARKPLLSPAFEHEHRHAVRQVHAALPRHHRQTQATLRRQGVEHGLRQAARFRTEHEGIAGGVVDLVVALTAAGRYAEPTRWLDRRKEVREIGMLLNRGELAVVEPGASQALVVELESERMNQVQSAAGIGAQAYDIAGIRRNLRLIEHDMKQREEPDLDG